MAIRELRAGERIQLTFPLREYETIEKAAGITYYVKWRGNAVLALEPRGTRMPLYKDRQQFLDQPTRVTPQRYP
jgi:hypothetical protein